MEKRLMVLPLNLACDFHRPSFASDNVDWGHAHAV